MTQYIAQRNISLQRTFNKIKLSQEDYDCHRVDSLVCLILYYYSQLMPKRINLAVNKLINRSTKPTKPPIEKILPHKPQTFEQLLALARRNSSHVQSTYQHQSLPFFSTNTSHNQSQYIKSNVNTPQNSSRAVARRKDKEDKLNHSLENKRESVEKKDKRNRSFSSQKYKACQSFEPERIVKKQSKYQNKSKQYPLQGKAESPPKSSEARNFNEQFAYFLNMLDHSAHSHMRQTQCFLSIEETFTLMKQLHYLRKIQDQKYLVKIWRELEGDTYGGIPSENLYEFLSFINHYNPTNLYPKHKNSSSAKKIVIDSNLKISATQQSKLQIYEQYLALRVNRILYGNGDGDYESSEKKLKRTSNIKIVDDDLAASGKKQRTSETRKRSSFGKKDRASQGQVAPMNPRRSVRLKSANPSHRSKKDQENEKDKSQETVCYSQISQTKESGKNLTSNESQHSLNNISSEETLPQRKPILSIDVNLGEGLSEKLLVFEGETALEVSRRLVEKYNIDESLRVKFESMLNGHIKNLLWRIQQVSEELISDREQ